MIEKITERDGEQIIEVRSDGGKLLFVKTRIGYEMKCPRTKKICLIKYEDMLKDCFQRLDQKGGDAFLRLLSSKIDEGR